MANAETNIGSPPAKRSKKGIIIALALALCAAGGGFFLAFAGVISIGESDEDSLEPQPSEPLKAIEKAVYVPLDPLVVNIRSSSKYQLLRFVGQLEVKPEHFSDIELLKPRIMDVMNTYLNALEAAHFEDPIALIKLRSQLLRRMQIVTGQGRIEDLLIMEFILQ